MNAPAAKNAKNAKNAKSGKDGEWRNGARLALSLVVNVEEGSEYSVFDGDGWPEPVDELLTAVPRKSIRGHGNESNYEYGIREGWPRIKGILRDCQATATVAAAAAALERAPAIALDIRELGYEPCAHGYRWLPQHRMAEAEERTFIQRAVKSIEASVGRRPVGWLSRYLHTDNTRRLLLEEGFKYHMDDYSADAPFWDAVPQAGAAGAVTGAVKMVVMPYALDSNDMKLWLAPAMTPSDWAAYAKRTLDILYEEGGERLRMMSLGLHLRIIGRPGRSAALADFLAYARARPGVWIATREDIAAEFAERFPDQPARTPLRGVPLPSS